MGNGNKEEKSKKKKVRRKEKEWKNADGMMEIQNYQYRNLFVRN
jgi:hypothetical protein